jgi:glycosyltransferase involved in cell wall biosynthesis
VFRRKKPANARHRLARQHRSFPVSADTAGQRILPRTLAGATVLQIVPALRDDAIGRTALEVAQSLLHAGARAVVAGEGGPLVVELRALGGEWFPLASRSINPLQLRRNAQWLQSFASTERVDLIHAQTIGSAWSALTATKRLPVWLLVGLPDIPKPPTRRHGYYLRALHRADQIVAPSRYVVDGVSAPYRIAREKVLVIPRRVDTTLFNPAAVRPQRMLAMRRAWRVRPGERVVALPGRVATWNGQLVLVDAARLLVNGGWRGVCFVLVGDSRDQRRYVRAVRNRMAAQGVEALFRIIGHCPDMPTALAAADIVVLPALEAPALGRAVAEAQAMGRLVIASRVGMLPENLLAPPGTLDAMRTGWTVRPGDASELAQAIATALTVDPDTYRAMAARARQYAESRFSPASVVAATHAVYAALLARER